MMNVKRILVPLDGSVFAEAALPVAMRLGHTFDASVEIVSVFEQDSVIATSGQSELQFKEWLRGYLDDLVVRLAEVSQADFSYTIVDGWPPDRLVKYANESQADLLVMSTHGRGVISRAWLGSVADHVLRHVSVPVLLVRADDNDAPDLSSEAPMRKILVAVDGSPFSERSLGWAADIAKRAGGSVTLLRAVEPAIPFASPYLPHAVMDTREVLESACGEAERYLDELKRGLQEDDVGEVDTSVLAGLHPAQGILDYAATHPADMIVITTHGRTGIARAILGSVADKVVRGSAQPVLLIRPTKQEAIEPPTVEAASHSRSFS